jgi:hypothetical protein
VLAELRDRSPHLVLLRCVGGARHPAPPGGLSTRRRARFS